MRYPEIYWNLGDLMFCQSPIWAWKWSSSLVSPYLFWYLATSNIPLLQLTQFTKKINTKYLHEKEKSKEIDGPLFRRAQNTGMSRTFHQHRHRCKQLVQHGWYLTLSRCGNDDQLASGGKHRHSELKNERHWPRKKPAACWVTGQREAVNTPWRKACFSAIYWFTYS